MKRLISIILCMIMTLSVIPFAASANGFDDVADGKWYTEGIKFCVENGYMAGVSDTFFDRNGTLTRAMFVTILAQVDGINTAEYADRTLFGDVTIGKWYTGAITWAAENNLASGIGEGLFGYKNNVTREQMALFLYVYSEYKSLDVSASADLSGFTDAGRIHDWALDAVKWAVATELISGTSGTTLDPRGTCTRAQAAVIIHAFAVENAPEHVHEWNAPLCLGLPNNYCLICGEKTDAVVDHEYNENGYCIYCHNIKPCETHVWVPATCTDCGYCAVCYMNNPDDSYILGHDFDEETHVCSRCRLFRDWTLSNYENIKKNIQLNGISLADGSLAIADEFEEGTVYIFMRPNNDEDFFVQFWPNPESEILEGHTGMVELLFDDTVEVEFNMEISHNGEFMFSASGNFDENRDQNFTGLDYTGCTQVENIYNETELSDEEIFDIICYFLSSTMINAGTTASNKLETNFDPDI